MVLRALRKRWYVIPIVLLAILVFPLIASAAINPQGSADYLQVLNAAINGVIFAARDTYCAFGVDQLCPVFNAPAS